MSGGSTPPSDTRRPSAGSRRFYEQRPWYLQLARGRQGLTLVLEVGEGPILREVERLPPGLVAGWAGDRNVFASISDGMGTRLALLSAASIDTLSGRDTLFAAHSIGRNGRRVAFSAETGEVPSEIWVADLDPSAGRMTGRRTVTFANTWLDSIAVAQARVYRWAAADGSALDAQLLLPPDYDGNQPLPAVLMPYGAYLNSFPAGDDFMSRGIQVLAARGVAVLRPNTRGIANEMQTSGYGEIQLADTNALLDSLVTDGIVDPTRIALLGHSHGGAMVYYYMSHSERFVGGSAVNGAAGWILQAERRDMSGLPWRLGGTPEEIPDTYQLFSPLENAAAVRSPILAVAGLHDGQIPATNAVSMVDRLRSLGRPAELLLFENEDHWIREPDNVRRFWEKVLAFLSDMLGLPA